MNFINPYFTSNALGTGQVVASQHHEALHSDIAQLLQCFRSFWTQLVSKPKQPHKCAINRDRGNCFATLTYFLKRCACGFGPLVNPIFQPYRAAYFYFLALPPGTDTTTRSSFKLIDTGADIILRQCTLDSTP